MKKIIFITGTRSGFGKLTTLTLAKADHMVITAIRGINSKKKQSCS